MNTFNSQQIDFAGAQLHEVQRHIEEHKYLANESIPFEISSKDAYESWSLLVFTPLTEAIEEFKLGKSFPEKNAADLFLAVSQHWYFLKKDGAVEVSAREAVLDFGARFASTRWARTKFAAKSLFQ